MATEFQVPQFTDIEDKIFGPFTLKQFIYLAGGAGGVFLVHVFFGNLLITILLGAPIAGLAVALAFYKINDRPFAGFLENLLKYYASNRMFIWKQPKAEKKSQSSRQQVELVNTSTVNRDRLKELAWSLDIKEKK